MLFRSVLVAATLACALTPMLSAQGLPAVPVPRENPITAEKAVLGKILFWDEQLSADDTMACGTCHQPAAGGGDPVVGMHPGFDGRFGTADDVRGSRGVVNRDAQRAYAPEPMFGLDRQATRRVAPSAFTSQWATEQFWDGRAGDTFIDPQSGQPAIPTGGSLESQAVGPLFSSAEMAHVGRSWSELIGKLTIARPLALATNLPADVSQALAAHPTYPDLFRAAFGDPAITAVRVAFAIATYERTLVPDQTPWDLYIAGNTNALTAQQVLGLQVFDMQGCSLCHTPPFFADHIYHNIGVRPSIEDEGRKEVTGLPDDLGAFRTPSLRGIALKPAFMHNGRFTTLTEVVDFYGGRLPNFPDNLDPIYIGMTVPLWAVVPLVDFLENALVDPRMAQELPPFDRPTLRSERAPNLVYAAGTAGSSTTPPRLLAHQPAFVGAGDFRIGLRDAVGGAPAVLALSIARRSYPGFPLALHVDLDLAVTLDTVLGGAGAGAGYGTWQLPLPAIPQLAGGVLRTQAVAGDPAGPFGLVSSDAVEITID
ncbi:MAG: hypothetical protein IPM29_27040 [Planctomycetes bacterium]|nr:hypothetical protein [Planctomycetota bacterium]